MNLPMKNMTSFLFFILNLLILTQSSTKDKNYYNLQQKLRVAKGQTHIDASKDIHAGILSSIDENNETENLEEDQENFLHSVQSKSQRANEFENIKEISECLKYVHITKKLEPQECDYCEEKINDDVYILEEEKKLCARCTLAHFSYDFPKYSIEEIEIFCVHILGNLMKEEEEYYYKWVDYYFQKHEKILKIKKLKNKSFDLFLLMHPILDVLNIKEFLVERKCEKCQKTPFQLFKKPCCQKLSCLQCIFKELYPKGKPECNICHKSYMRLEHAQFEDTFKTIYLAFVKKSMIQITEEKINEITKFIRSPGNVKKANTHAKFANMMTFLLKQEQVLPKLKKILFPDEDNNGEILIYGKTLKTIVALFALTITPLCQLKILSRFQNFNFALPTLIQRNELRWIVWNSCIAFSTNTYFSQYIIHKKYTISKKRNEEIETLRTIRSVFTLCWLNFIFNFLNHGISCTDKIFFVFWTVIFGGPVLWLLKIFEELYYQSEEEENVYIYE